MIRLEEEKARREQKKEDILYYIIMGSILLTLAGLTAWIVLTGTSQLW